MRCFLNGAPALRRPWLLLITMVLGCSTASAEFTWSATAGVIGGDGSRGLHRDDLDYRGAELDARAVEKMSAGSLSVSVGVDTNLGETQGERRTTYELQEGVYVWTWNRWELAVGRQRLQWGRADGVNPTDVWTPRSYDRPTLV